MLVMIGTLTAGGGVAGAGETAACPEANVTARVTDLGAGGELRLDDGRVLKLASVALDFGATGFGADHVAARNTALAELAVGRRIAVATTAPEGDRYGRLVGLATLVGDDGQPEDSSLQQALLELGLAVLQPDAAYAGCLAGLSAAEDEARAARRGLWAVMPVPAGAPKAVGAFEGRYAVIEGRVESVGDRRETLYLNFGRVWRQDVTVTVPRPARAAFERDNVPLGSLAGRAVRVRGTVHEDGGPAIEARFAGQIELVGNEGR